MRSSPTTAARPVLTQLGLAVLLERGELDRHVRSSRLVYRRRRDALIAALERHLPELRPHGAAAGLHLLVDLPARRRRGRAGARPPQARGVGLDSLAPALRPPQRARRVILGYGRIAEPAIEPGVRALAARDRGRDAELTAGGLWLAPCSLPPAPRSGGWCLPSSSTCAGRSRGASPGAACSRRRGPRSRAGACARGTSAARASAACSPPRGGDAVRVTLARRELAGRHVAGARRDALRRGLVRDRLGPAR